MGVVDGEELPKTGMDTWLIYAGVLLAPFINLRIDIAFTLSSLFYSMAFVGMLCRGTLPRSPMGILAWTWFPAMVLIIAGLHISSLVNGSPVRGVILTVEYAFCFLVLPCVLLKPTLAECYRLLLVFVSGVTLLNLHGIATFFLVGYVSSSLVVTGNMRLATLIANPNGAACLDAITILALVWLLAERRIPKLVGIPYLAVTGFALILTSSNTGLIAVVAGLLVYGALTLRIQNLLQVLFILCIPVGFLAAGGVSYLPQTFQKRVLAAVVEGDVSEAGTYMSRSDLNREALDTIDKRKIFFLGLGADQFRTISVQEVPVHNVFLILWVEGGIFPLFGWLILMSSGGLLWARARAAGVMYHGRAATLAAFVIFFVVANARAHLYTPYWYTAVLLIIGPTVAALRQSARHRAGESLRDPEPAPQGLAEGQAA